MLLCQPELLFTIKPQRRVERAGNQNEQKQITFLRTFTAWKVETTNICWRSNVSRDKRQILQPKARAQATEPGVHFRQTSHQASQRQFIRIRARSRLEHNIIFRSRLSVSQVSCYRANTCTYASNHYLTHVRSQPAGFSHRSVFLWRW